ncbi:hypothetical protein BsWGS_26957 [Bradybaena similaris]
MLLFAATVLICFVNADGARNQAVLDLFQHEYHGDGTYYGNIKEGTCAYGTDLPPAATNPKIRSLVALNAPQFMGSLVCGLCLRVVGSGHGLGTNPISGEYIVFTKDLCPVCKAGDVDFALDGDGRWDIVIQAVQCPVGNTKIQYSFHGSNQWFVKLQIRNARIPITEVQLQRNGVWVTPNHNIDGHWLVSDSHEWQAGSIEIRMTAANGQTLEDTIPRIENDVVLNGLKGVQVALDSSLPSV